MGSVDANEQTVSRSTYGRGRGSSGFSSLSGWSLSGG